MIAFVPFVFALIPLMFFSARRGLSMDGAARIAVRTAAVAAVLFALFVAYLFFRTGSPLWGLGLITVPLLAGEYLGIVLLVSWSTLYGIAAIRTGAGSSRNALYIESVAVIALIGVSAYAVSEWRVARAGSVAPGIGDLQAIYHDHPRDRHVAAVLASREITPRDVLRAIGTNPPPSFRVRPNTYRDLLRNDEVPVLVHLARNRSTPPEILALLAADPMPDVAAAAAANAGTPPFALAHAAPAAAIGLASNPQTSPEQLLDFASDSGTGVRERVASNPSTPADALQKLTADPNMMVRLHLVSNPSLPLHALEILASDSNSSVSRSARAQIELRTKRSGRPILTSPSRGPHEQ